MSWRHRPTEMDVFAIDDITGTEPRRIRVQLKHSGEEIWLPRSEVTVMPGHVAVPLWLVAKMKLTDNPYNKKGGQP